MNGADLDAVVKNLQSTQGKIEGLSDLAQMMANGRSTALFLGQLDKLFLGLRSCLVVDSSSGMDIQLKANQILIEMIPDILHSDDVEIQFAQLIPVFIENLGSPKVLIIRYLILSNRQLSENQLINA